MATANRFIRSAAVTTKLQSTLHLFDLIVGTEEEFHIAGGSTRHASTLKAVRAVTDATGLQTRPHGSRGFRAQSLTASTKDRAAKGFPVTYSALLGAGDGFMSGLLRG